MAEGGPDAQEKQPNKFARHHPRDVQVPSVVARLGHHEAGYIQTPVLDVFGIHVVSGSRDLQGELVGGAEEPAAAVAGTLMQSRSPHLPLILPISIVRAKTGFPPRCSGSLWHGRGSWSGVGRCLLAVELQERAHNFLSEVAGS